MSERTVYQCKWCGPLMKTPPHDCLTYYLLKSDMYEFIDSMMMNSWMEIRPIIVNTDSPQFTEAMRWRNLYRQQPQDWKETCMVHFPE
jgi:hypothetical protein